ncbi:hypothetical protein RBU49_04195 [Clostridium sp. MB40-C1]|uniref:hypothetical protein n=1 Tax=Clostridium sp. MB40-C1 TaxID=3070996 RepID=UPI0027E1530F|nr:hypothetical protein [Clostridium sp. MB40-C1]WMJ81463.1 hypothetical protein RBU49_04195 [Clostridium sp. MB40-C1]
MRLDELKIKINWSNFYICKDADFYSNDVEFDLTPEDFLRFAKEDYKNLDNRGLVGVLSNSKRAIDCQVDWIISYLGFDYLNFNELNYPNIKELINKFEERLNNNNNLSFKLRFIQALEIAPIFLISKIRKFRNKLEHEYIVPKEDEAREAIEIAELFVNATQNIILHKVFSNYSIQNEYDEEKNKLELPYIKVHLDLCSEDEKIINIRYKADDVNKGEISLKPNDKEYILFIKVSVLHNFSCLPEIFKCNIDSKYISYKIKEF